LEGLAMQQIFNAGCNVQEYYKMQRNFPFPKPPDKCPNCGKYCRMKKHGYYRRNYFSKTFSGKILIRRYLCSKCKKTLSFLPSFCQPFFQYSPGDFMDILHQSFSRNTSLDVFCSEIRNKFPNLSFFRQHIRFYLNRIAKKLNTIKMYLRDINIKVKLPCSEAASGEKVRDVLDNIKAFCSFSEFITKQNKAILSFSF
jgi:ribosomal protein S27AE